MSMRSLSFFFVSELYGFLADESGGEDVRKVLDEQKEMTKRARRGPVNDFLVARFADQHANEECNPVEEAPLSLDRETAMEMRTQIRQRLGGSLMTAGIDPRIKYNVPLTTSQQIGWNASKFGSLEILNHNVPKHQCD